MAEEEAGKSLKIVTMVASDGSGGQISEEGTSRGPLLIWRAQGNVLDSGRMRHQQSDQGPPRVPIVTVDRERTLTPKSFFFSTLPEASFSTCQMSWEIVPTGINIRPGFAS